MKKKLAFVCILFIVIYFGQRIVTVLKEPNLPTKEGLFILPLECNNVKYLINGTPFMIA